MYGNLKLS